MLPDTQFYAEEHPEIIEAQIDWIVANQATERIIYVAQLGDLKDDQLCDNKTVNVGTGAGRTEWEILDQAFTDLDSAGIPYGVVPGNHDFDQLGGGCPNFDDERPLTNYNANFGPTRFSSSPNYGDPATSTPGNRVPNSNEDNFALFDSDGVRFIAINLAYKQAPDSGATDPELDWADNLLKAYPDRLGILTSHYFMEQNPGNSLGSYGQEVYDALSNNPNLFLMLSAHRRGEAWQVATTGRTGLQPVQILLADYQDVRFPTDSDPGTPANDPNPALIDFTNLSTGGTDSGFMRIMRFDTDTGTVDIETFIPPVVPIKNRPSTIVSTYSPADGNGMDSGTASNLGFSFLGYAATGPIFDIFECDDVAGGTCTSPLGYIEFPGDSGTQTDGSGFSLAYTCTGVFCDSAGYDENDIVNVDWTIDAGTGEVTALTMRLDTDPGCLSLASPLPCAQTAVNFTLISTGLTENTASGGSCSDDGSGPQCISGIAINGANLFVPRPR